MYKRQEETGGQLHDRLAEMGAQVLADGLGLLRAGMRPQARAQPAEGVTYAHKLEKNEAQLDWSQPAEVLARKVRAFEPWPVAEAVVAGERLRIHGAVSSTHLDVYKRQGEQVYQEGYLSVPGIFSDVTRAKEITVRYLDRQGQAQELQADGLLAVCIQHEMDHLDGKLFVDYLSPLKREMVRKKLAKQRKQAAA